MADMRCQWHDGWFYYSCQRDDIRFAGRYRPTPGGPQLTKPGSLEYFLTERYWLFAQSSAGVLSKARIHHYPWPLEPAEVSVPVALKFNRLDVITRRGPDSPVGTRLLAVDDRTGVVYNPIFGEWRTSEDCGVNYMMAAQKPAG